MILLTDEEIREAWEEPIKDITNGHDMFIAIQEQRAQKALAKAQLKTVVEYLRAHIAGGYPSAGGTIYQIELTFDEWQALLEEAK